MKETGLYFAIAMFQKKSEPAVYMAAGSLYVMGLSQFVSSPAQYRAYYQEGYALGYPYAINGGI